MIKNIFIPAFVKSYAVLEQKIVACEVTKFELKATLVTAKGNKRIIENYVTVFIEQNETQTFIERMQNAFTQLKSQIGFFNYFILVLPGWEVIFKDITIPFTDEEKIKKIVPFEVDKLLPFSINQAFVDSIVIHKDASLNSSRILVAACKRELIEEYLTACSGAQIQVDQISVDLFALYGFIKIIPEYAKFSGLYVLLDVDNYATRLLLLENGELLQMRSIPRGLLSDLGVAQAIKVDDVIRHGVHDSAVKNKLDVLMQEYLFTIQAMLTQHQVSQQMPHIFIAGNLTQVPGIQEYMKQYFSTQIDEFFSYKVIQNGTISARDQRGVPAQYEVSLAAALYLEPVVSFNLIRIIETPREERLSLYQLYVITGLTALILITLITSTIINVRSLKNEAYSSEQETITRLKKVFALRNPATLDEAIRASGVELAKEKNIWFALSTENRFSYLTYLQELFARIDREGLGLDLKKLSIKSADGASGDDALLLEGSVRNYDALRKFEESLVESKLFKSVPKLQETSFSINLYIDKSSIET